MTDREKTILKYLALLGHPSLGIAPWAFPESIRALHPAPTLKALERKHLVVGFHQSWQRAKGTRYWSITDAGREALAEEEKSRE